LTDIRFLRFARWLALFRRYSEYRTRHKTNNRYVKELVYKLMAHAPRTVPLRIHVAIRAPRTGV
jgi:hypothetical protein